MAEVVLTQDEIDQLLSSVDAGDLEPEGFKPPQDHRKIKIYDFKRPDRFSKRQIRALIMLHETFARHATLVLDSRSHMFCHVHVASVDQLTHEEFMRSIPMPTCIVHPRNIRVRVLIH
jgi:flagellar motor switch protein FliM